MPSPEQERLDIISATLGRILRQQADFEQRLLHMESALRVTVPQEALAPVVAEPEAVRETVMPPPLPVMPPLVAVDDPLPAAPVQTVKAEGKLETSIGLTLVNRIGVITLVLGIGFLFKLAVDNNVIGPAGRVELGLLAGLLAIAGADVLWRRGQTTFAQGGTATGISILYLSIYAAFGFYHLIPQALAFGAMFVTVLMATALALRYDGMAIAALGLAGGFLAPMLLSSGQNRPWFLFSFVFLLDVGTLALVRVRQWRRLEILSFLGTLLLYGGWYDSFHEPAVATVFGLVFYGIFAWGGSYQWIAVLAQFFTALVITDLWKRHLGQYFTLSLLLGAAGMALSDRKRWRFALPAAFTAFWVFGALLCVDFPAPRPVETLFAGLTAGFGLFMCWIPWWFLIRREAARSQDLGVLALNGAAYFGVSYALLNPRYHAWMGLFAVATAAIHLALGYALWQRQTDEQRNDTPVLLAIGVALSLITLAAPIQFAAWRVTMSWALEGAALSWVATRVHDRRVTFASAAVFLLAFLRLGAEDAWIYRDPKVYAALFNARFLTFLVCAVCLLLAAWWAERPRELRLAYYLGGHFVLLWGLTLEVVGWAARTTAVENVLSVETISVSILYAVYAVALIGAGVATRTAVNRVVGLGLIGLVVLKLYVFDVWQLGRMYRTVAFVALGALLLSTSFLYSHFRTLIESWWKDDEVAS